MKQAYDRRAPLTVATVLDGAQIDRRAFAGLGIADPREGLPPRDGSGQAGGASLEAGEASLQTAKLLGVDQPQVCALIRGRLTGFSLDRLLRFLLLFGQDIRITVQATPRTRSRARVIVA
jgi:hypothetical protein